MVIGSILGPAVTGLQRNISRFDRTVERIAGSHPLDDLPRNMVDLMVSQRTVEASAVTVRTADEMVGTLLDILT